MLFRLCWRDDGVGVSREREGRKVCWSGRLFILDVLGLEVVVQVRLRGSLCITRVVEALLCLKRHDMTLI